MAKMRRTRLTQEERRAQFKEAARRLFERKGFENVTTKEIAEEAGLSRSLIYQYEASKTEILEDLLRDLVCEQANALEVMPRPTGTAADRVMAYLVCMLERDLAQFELRRLSIVHSWTWSKERESEFFFLLGSVMDPISLSLEEIGIGWNLADRIAIWAIYSEGLRQTINLFAEQREDVSHMPVTDAVEAFDGRVRPQIARLFSDFGSEGPGPNGF